MSLNYFLKINKHYQKVSAFTLVEILVVLGLFSSISTLSLGALFNAQAINTHLQDTQSILDNVNLSVQTITRDVRFGSKFNCVLMPVDYIRYFTPTQSSHSCSFGVDGSLPGNILGFKESDAVNDFDRSAFYVENGVLYKKEFYGNPINPASTTVLQMTSNDVEIRTLSFYVDGAESASDPIPDYKQPLVTMLLSGVTKPTTLTNVPVEFNLEIIMSGRQPDNK
jgi:type II secretory pathway pseudopilin PulG